MSVSVRVSVSDSVSVSVRVRVRATGREQCRLQRAVPNIASDLKAVFREEKILSADAAHS